MDFEAMIRDAQKNGLSIDDIAKMFSKTLNAVQQEDQKKKAITDARTDAAVLYTLTMAEKYPDWTAENIKDYFQIIKLNAETTATMVGKEPDELLQVLLDKVDNLFDAVPKNKDEKIADFLREIGL
jgi:hypothetical protein